MPEAEENSNSRRTLGVDEGYFYIIILKGRGQKWAFQGFPNAQGEYQTIVDVFLCRKLFSKA